MPGQAGLEAATCLEELSEEWHPPRALAGRVAQGPLPAEDCLLRTLSAPGRSRWVIVCIMASRRARAGDTHPWGGTAGKPPVCLIHANYTEDQVLHGLVMDPLMELVPLNLSSHGSPKSECWR